MTVTANRNFANSITKGKQYKVVQNRDRTYLIEDNDKHLVGLQKSYFKESVLDFEVDFENVERN